MAKNSADEATAPHIAFAAPAGTVDITQIPTDSAPIGPSSKSDAEDGLQESGRRGTTRSTSSSAGSPTSR